MIDHVGFHLNKHVILAVVVALRKDMKLYKHEPVLRSAGFTTNGSNVLLLIRRCADQLQA